MQRSVKFVVAASMAIGGISFLSSSRAEADYGSKDQPSGQGQAGTSGQAGQSGAGAMPDAIIIERVTVYGVVVPSKAAPIPAGFKQTELKDAPEIKRTLGQCTQAAAQKGNANKLLDHLTKADQQRVRDSFMKARTGKLDECVAKIEQGWQEKYHQKLGGDQVGKAFSEQFVLAEGQITNPQMLSNWPVRQPEPGKQEDQKKDPGQMDKSMQLDRESLKTGTESAIGGATETAKRQADRVMGEMGGQAGQKPSQLAVIVFPAEGDSPETYVSLVKEEDAWKINIPDNINGQQLYDNLVSHLDQIGQNKDRWPADQNEACRTVAHHVAMALYGQNQQGQDSEREGGTAQPR
jgi:hypothetical protein